MRTRKSNRQLHAVGLLFERLSPTLVGIWQTVVAYINQLPLRYDEPRAAPRQTAPLVWPGSDPCSPWVTIQPPAEKYGVLTHNRVFFYGIGGRDSVSLVPIRPAGREILVTL